MSKKFKENWELSTGSLKLHLICPNEIFDWTIFLWIFSVSSKFFDCGQKILQHWRRNFREVVKSAFYLNNRTFRGKFNFWRKYLLLQVFRVLIKNSATSVGKCATRFEKLLSTPVHGIFLHNNIFFLEKINAHERILRENVWNFVNIFWRGGQNCFLCVQRNFVEKQFSLFWKSSKLSVVFRLWGKHFGFLAKKILMKINFIYEFIKNCFFHELFEFRYCFPTVGRKICKIGAETLEKVSKVHSTWTTELFEESLFSQDNIYF